MKAYMERPSNTSTSPQKGPIDIFYRAWNSFRSSNITILLHNIQFHAYSLWLFTFSDLKTIIVPSTMFGIANAQILTRYTEDSIAIERMLSTLLWVWMNLLPFAINNQRATSSITEDTVNKPWRPLPSGRISQPQAGRLMILLYVCEIIYSATLSGGLRQALMLIVLGAWYNNFGGADVDPVVRNGINAVGYLCFITGALEVSLGHAITLSPWSTLSKWFGVIGCIVFTTVHSQDLHDQEGDSLRGRRTIPIVFGDITTRWIISVVMLLWGAICPLFWRATATGWTLSMALATTVAVRTSLLRTVENDKVTFLCWNMWMTVVYLMPIFAQITFSDLVF